MKIFLPFDFKLNPRNFMRRAGYAVFADPNTGKTSYVRRLSGDFYPRFHAYFESDNNNQRFINLHLDQKKPSYPGSSAHSAEYQGAVVEREGRRLEGLIKNEINNQGQKSSEYQKGFWQQLFR